MKASLLPFSITGIILLFVRLISQKLAKHGVKLENSYVAPKCSPSRAALLTGMYPFR